MSTSAVVVPDGGWGWVIVFVSFSFHLLVGFIYAAQSILYVSLQDDFHQGKGITSWILSAFNTCLVIIGPLSASLGVRYGYKIVTFAGGFLMGLGMFVSYLATSIDFLILTLGVVTGIGAGLAYVPVVAMSALYFDKKRSVAVGLGTSGVGVGTFAVPPLLTFLAGEYAWRGMLLIISGCMFNMCVLALLLRPLSKVVMEQEYQVDEKEQDDGAVDERCGLFVHEDVADYSLVAVEEIDVADNDNESRIEVVRNDDRIGNGTQSLSNITSEVTPSPTEIPEAIVKATSPGRGRLNMASEIMRRNKDLISDNDRGRSLSFNHNTSISSENVHLPRKEQLRFCSVQDIHRRHHSNIDVARDNQSQRSTNSHGKSLTNMNIMLMGSIYNIVSIDHNLNSMLSLTSKKSIEISQLGEGVDSPEAIPREPHSQSRWVIFKEYVDLLRNKKCSLLMIINFLVNLTYLTPVLYIVDRAVENGVDRDSAVISLSLYGAGNICGRVLTGVIADFRCVNRIVLYFLSIFVCGLVTVLSIFCGDVLPLHAAYGLVFGIFIGGYVILTPVVLVDILGIQMVSQSYGLCLLFQAAAVMIGTPMAGWMYDISKSYTVSFILYGSFVIFSSILMLPLVYNSLREQSRDGQNSQDEKAPLDAATS